MRYNNYQPSQMWALHSSHVTPGDKPKQGPGAVILQNKAYWSQNPRGGEAREVVAMGTGHHCKPHHSQGLPCEVLLWQLAVPEAAFLLPSALQSVPHRAAVLPPRLPDGGPAAQWAAVWCPQDCQWEANPSKFFKLHPSCCGHLCVLPPQLPPGGRISASFMCLQPPLVIFTAGYGGQRATHMPLRHCQFSAPSLI